MEDSNHRLHSVALSETEENKNISNDKPMPIKKTKICCFETNNTTVYKIYDENDCLLCKCLDWCSLCSNSYKKSKCCKKNIVCYMCCCSITFE
jgi:hypothetical protein